MTITLADVYMLTILRITGSIQPYEYLSAGSKKLAKIADCTGWANYILNHVGDESTVSDWRDSSSMGRLVVRLTTISLWQSIL